MGKMESEVIQCFQEDISYGKSYRFWIVKVWWPLQNALWIPELKGQEMILMKHYKRDYYNIYQQCMMCSTSGMW